MLKERTVGGKTEYLVKWEGYDAEEDNTWEPAKEIRKTEAFKAWSPGEATQPAAKKKKKKAESDDEAEVSDSDSDDGSDGGDWKPEKSKSAAKAAPGKKAAARTPATAASGKKVAKRPLEAEEDDVPLTEESMLQQLATWDAPALKSFIGQLCKEANAGSWHFNHVFRHLKAPAKKGECLDDARVCVRAVYAGLGTTTLPYESAEPRFQSERVRSCALPSGVSAAAAQKAVETAFSRCRGGVQNKRQKAAMRPEAKALLPKLEVLDKAQLATLVCTLVDAGHVDSQVVINAMPSADLEPLLKARPLPPAHQRLRHASLVLPRTHPSTPRGAAPQELEKLVKAISRALPNSRWGSCTDNYGYKRCASACNTAKRKFLEGVKQYKSSKQWGAAKEFADRALPIAHQMVVFDNEANNGARSAVLAALKTLQTEAQGQMCVD